MFHMHEYYPPSSQQRQEKGQEKLLALCRDKDTELSVIKHTLDSTLSEISQKYGLTTASGVKELIHLRKEVCFL